MEAPHVQNGRIKESGGLPSQNLNSSKDKLGSIKGDQQLPLNAGFACGDENISRLCRFLQLRRAFLAS